MQSKTSSQLALFEPPTQLSPALQEQEAKMDAARLAGVLTHHSNDMPPGEGWMAILPFDDDRGKTIDLMIAESCRLYDEAGRVAFGPTREIAILNLFNQGAITL